MQENLLSYNNIVSYFGEKTLADRFKFLFDKMQKYIDERGQQADLYINENMLHQVVMDYFADIYRLKEFHKIKQVNITKIIAYEVFWILRRKPLQVRQESSDAKLIYANEGFLTTFIAHEFLMPEESEPIGKANEASFLKYLQHLNYHLKYRNVDKQCLEAMLYSFEVGKNISGN